MRGLILACLVACSGAQKPRSTGMQELAAEMDAQFAELTRIVHDLRGDCPRMAARLKAVFARMTKSIDRAHAAEKDPALAKELTTYMRSYDDVQKQRNAQMDADLAENAKCLEDPAVRDTMLAMPTL